MTTKTITSSFFSITSLLLAAAALGGCSNSGDDVYFETTAAKQSRLCTVAVPGEDVCGRGWTSIDDPSDRDWSLATLEVASTFAGLAAETLDNLKATCGRTLDDLGIIRPTFNESADAELRAKTTCEWAVVALQTKKKTPAMFALTVTTQPACTPKPAPSCASLAKENRKACDRATVAIAYEDEATDQDKRVGETVRRNTSVVMQTKTNLEEIANLSATLTSQVSKLQSQATCASQVTVLLQKATDDIRLAAELSTSLSDVM